MPTFNNLKMLRISGSVHPVGWQAMPVLLQNCPHLETLQMEVPTCQKSITIVIDRDHSSESLIVSFFFLSVSLCLGLHFPGRERWLAHILSSGKDSGKDTD